MEPRIERRPMTQEERAYWKRATATAAARAMVCATCGDRAFFKDGSLEDGTPYCHVHFQRAERARMRASTPTTADD